MSNRIVEETDRDFDKIYDAVMTTAQGRWFVRELTERHCRQDTDAILSAIAAIPNSSGPISENKNSACESGRIREVVNRLSTSSIRLKRACDPTGLRRRTEELISLLNDIEFQAARLRTCLNSTAPSYRESQPKRDASEPLPLPPELADEAALVEGFDEVQPWRPKPSTAQRHQAAALYPAELIERA